MSVSRETFGGSSGSFSPPLLTDGEGSSSSLFSSVFLDALLSLPTGLRRYSAPRALFGLPDGTWIAGGCVVSGSFCSRRGKPFFGVRGVFVPLGLSHPIPTPPAVITLAFFGAGSTLSQQRCVRGVTVFFRGRLSVRSGGRVFWITQPQLFARADLEKMKAPVVLYPQTVRQAATLSSRRKGYLRDCPVLPEWLPAVLLEARGWPDWRAAICAAHAPLSDMDLSLRNPARQRLLCDELVANGLLAAQSAQPGVIARSPVCSLPTASPPFPFVLTPSQQLAISEIAADLAKPIPMVRILLGDVGSGKTAVALAAMLQVVKAGYQALFMAPTDILARQHFCAAQSFFAQSGFTVVLLTAHERGAARRAALEQIASCSSLVIVGTHALLESTIPFCSLGLVVIDEQQRFGVQQRLLLSVAQKSGLSPHVLTLSATPIPRSLLLAHNQEMHVSRLSTRALSRKPVHTCLVSEARMSEVLQGLGRILAAGHQVYWVCPRVQSDPKAEMVSVEDRASFLSTYFPGRVAVLHGQLPAKDKHRTMEDFVGGRCAILVATTVIEIGVDVPNATVMVIEHPERFGLAQLHQLRGRVGRGAAQSSCILLYPKDLSDVARQRLAIIRHCRCGEQIAEMDLWLRGAGDLFGTRQAGRAATHWLPSPQSSPQIYIEMLKIYTDIAVEAAGVVRAMMLRPLLPAEQMLCAMWRGRAPRADFKKAG